jgi:class 3 adenylate cyclase/tetratricopeptide (TPR) repeat protein
MTCPSCGTAPPPLARFCPECGTAVLRPCASCGAALGAGHRFCASCGTRAEDGPDQEPEPAHSERRVSSVLFGDLVGFTGLAESRDPEDVRELLTGYFDRCRDVVARYGGTIEKFIGDAVMAVWGVPVAHEDDAERAVRAGLDLVDAVVAFGERTSVPGLAMRVGVITGEVAVTLGATGQGMVAGDAVNTAARVQAKADPGAVWVDEQTRALTAAAIAYEPAGSHALKGKTDPVVLHRATAVMGGVGGEGRELGIEAPLVGRRRELSLLKDLYQAAVEDGRGRLLVVTGAPGVGKTRLGWELQKYTDGLSAVIWWHWGRCPAYGDGIAYSALSAALRRRIDVDETAEPAPAQRERLRRHLAEIVPDAQERDWLEPRLSVLLGGEDSFGREDLFTAWLTWFERISHGGDPVIWVIDDAHHADDGLLDFVEYLVGSARFPLLLVLLAREELLERRPRLAASRRGTVIGLEGLRPETMAQLLDALVVDLPPRVRDQLVEVAEGVPLYAVETVRALLDRGMVVDDGSRRRLAPGVDAAGLVEVGAPTSLQMLIASRLDALPPDQRELLQYASVLGNAFTLDGLAAVSGRSPRQVTETADALAARDLVARVADRFSPDFGRYAFVQALVRQVAYRTQSRQARLNRHLAAARYLQTQAETSGELVAVVAQHLADARELMPPGDPRAAGLTDDLVEWLIRSGQRAASLGVPEEASSFYVQALAHAPQGTERVRLTVLAAQAALDAGHWDQASALAGGLDDGDPLDLRARAATVRATAHRLLGRSAEAIHELAPYLDLAGELSAGTASVLLRMAARAYGELGESATGRPLAEEGLRRAEQTEDPVLIGWALNDLAVLIFFTDLQRVGIAILDGAIAYCSAHHATGPLVAVLFNRAIASFTRDVRAALRIYEQALELSRQAADAWTAWLTTASVSVARMITGRWDDEANDDTAWLYEGVLAEDAVFRYLHAALQALRALMRGDRPDDGMAEVDEAVLDAAGPEVVQEVALIRLVRARLSGGLRERALELAEATVSAREGKGATVEWFPFLWTTAVDWLLEAGTPEDLAVARRAVEVVDTAPGRREPAVLAELPRLRAFLALADPAGTADLETAERELREAIPALEAYGAEPDRGRAQAALGQLLERQGRTEEARALLAEAEGTFARLGVANRRLRLAVAAA